MYCYSLSGGPYRQFFTDIGRELQEMSGADPVEYALPLFVQCPNAQVSVGDNRDKYVARPSSSSANVNA